MDTASLPADVMVSVCMITYNHEAYITQAIEGVLMQQTDFRVELVIGEDCSTDRTREIVRGYAEKYPERIRLQLNDHNLGSQHNFVATLKACNGKYIALCEGDDYWTDPYKLQKQIDFLENNLNYAFCFHLTCKLFQSTGEIKIDNDRCRKASYDLEDVLNSRSGISTVSVTFRNGIIKEFPKWYMESPVGDTPLFVLLAQYGKIGFMEQVMGVYRIHNKGLWQSADDLARVRMGLKTFTLLQTYLGQEYEKEFLLPFSKLYLEQARISADLGDVADAKIWLKKSITTSFSFKGKWIDRVALLGRLYLPQLYGISKRILRRT